MRVRKVGDVGKVGHMGGVGDVRSEVGGYILSIVDSASVYNVAGPDVDSTSPRNH